MRGWRIVGVLLAGALVAAALAPDQLASWGDAHADRPGGAAAAAVLHGWNNLVAPLARPRAVLHRWSRAAVERQF